MSLPWAWVAIGLLVLWGTTLAAIVATRWRLLRSTWAEPYVEEAVVIIESDDWGPGPPSHLPALRSLLEILGRHRDSLGRPAVLTADMVMSVPDGAAMSASGYRYYRRRTLGDDFPELLAAMREGMESGTFYPQLHGCEHLNPQALLRRAQGGDPEVCELLETPGWCDWEALDSPLQGHFVDGGKLPTAAVDAATQREMVAEGVALFVAAFGEPPTSAVAPCYLWDDNTERAWQREGVRYIQTAGYRCIGRDGAARYLQDPPWIHPGSHNRFGQIYLVRNVMYEPADGRDWQEAWRQLRRCVAEALPAVVSTHRYNYTAPRGDEAALEGLDRLLALAVGRFSALRFAASPEWGRWVEEGVLQDSLSRSPWPALRRATIWRKVAGFIRRLWNRHHKLRWLCVASGLVLPGAVVVWVADRLNDWLGGRSAPILDHDGEGALNG